jgi:hypothetical protein
MPRLAAIPLSVALTFSGLALVAHHELATTSPEISLEAGALPPAAAPGAASSSSTSPSVAAPPPTAVPDEGGIPVQLVIPFPSTHHPEGVTAPVTADPLTEDGDLFVPPDPRTVSWAEEDAAPGAARGTAILTGHVNNMVDGRVVPGALVDLAEYAVTSIGKTFTVVLADGRRLTYEIVAGVQYSKEQLAQQPQLREELYDQVSTFGPGQGSGRLLLVSCGGAFDNSTGNYEDNVFIYAMPVDDEAAEDAAAYPDRRHSAR